MAILYPMTKQGADMLIEELERLKNVERRMVIEAIAEARAHGDLSENAEYHAAKDKQGFIEARIAHIEMKLSQSQVIDPSAINNDGTVIFGAIVTLFDVDCATETIYQIVGEDEANIKARKISVNSPVAKALIGKKIGDCVSIVVPSGTRNYEVINIEY